MKNIYILYILLLIPLIGYSQISTGEQPYSWNNTNINLKNNIPVFTMPFLDMETINKEDRQNKEEGKLYRFGISHDVNLTLENSGIWEETLDGGRLWTLKINSPDALTISLEYNKFWLPQGAKFFIFTTREEPFLGAITSLNNKGTKDNPERFSTDFIYGNTITLEYYEPKGANGGIISIDQVISGYRNINSPEVQEFKEQQLSVISNDNWKEEKSSIVGITTNIDKMVFFSVGVLVNNTAMDNKPYVMTIHDFEIINPESLKFVWEVPYGLKSYAIITTGAQIRVKNKITDDSGGIFYLLELMEDPRNNPDITPYYLGWDCTGSPGKGGASITMVNDGTGYIYHKEYLNEPEKIDLWGDGNNIFSMIYWCFHDIDIWVVQGNPLVNNNRHLIGLNNHYWKTLKVGINPSPIYLTFDYMFNINKNNSNGIKYWLDPLNVIPSTGGSLDGKKVVCQDLSISNKTISSSKIFGGCSITINNTTINNSSTVLINAEEKVIIKPKTILSSGTTVIIKAKGNSTKSAEEETDITGISSDIVSDNSISLYPNPTEGILTFQCENTNMDCKVDIYNATGKLVYSNDNLYNGQTVDLSSQAKGIYLARITIDGQIKTQKIILK